MIEFLSTLATLSAFTISIFYGVGFLIIVYNRSRIGIDEVQVLNFKYIFVGYTFIVNHLMFFTLSYLISFLIFALTKNGISPVFITFLLSFVTFVVSVIFVVYALKYSKEGKTTRRKSSLHSRYFFFAIMSITGSLFPSFALNLFVSNTISVKYSVLIYQFTLDAFSLDLLRALLIMGWLFLFFSQLTYYSRYYYGIPNPLSVIDRTGIGLPNQVQFVFDENKSGIFSKMGIQILQPGITGMIQLIETTNDDYIVYARAVGDPATVNTTAIKVSKGIVMAVLYHPDEKSSSNDTK